MRKTREQIAYNMSRVRSTGSKIEKLIAIALRKKDVKFRRHIRSVEGNPDFVIKDKRVVIFCDSHFWHGHNWHKRKLGHKSNKKFWFKKIERNMARDREVNRMLRKQGWKVCRFWEHQILKNPDQCIQKVTEYLRDD